MQDYPLALPHIFHRAERLFPAKEIVTATATGRERTTYGQWAERTRRLAGAPDDPAGAAAGRGRPAPPAARRGARRPRRVGRRPGRHLRLEHSTPSRAVLRGAVHWAGAPHAEHP